MGRRANGFVALTMVSIVIGCAPDLHLGRLGVGGQGGGSSVTSSTVGSGPGGSGGQGGASSGGGHGGASSGGGQGGATSMTTGGSTTASTGTTTASTSTGGLGPIVFCNNAMCAAGEICCFNITQQTDHCGQSGTCGGGFIELRCNDPEDCPGGLCCADVDFQKNPPYSGIYCQQICDNPQTKIVVCSDAVPACPAGKQCGTSTSLGQGYKICK